jgi:hypothetical protein
MDAQIKRWEGKSFSGEDVFRLCDGKVRVLKYKELARYRTLNEAMGPHRALVLLYETRDNYGHWCAIFAADDDTLEFFDPYSMFPDDELDYIDPEFAKRSGQVPHLTYLIMKSGYRDIIYNREPLQRLRKDTNTCGRWCGLRICLRDMPLHKFVALFRKQKFPADWYVTALTMFV